LLKRRSRKRRMELLLFSEAGGMDIEKVDEDRIEAINIDPILGLQDYQLAQILRHANIDEQAKPGLKRILRELYGVFKSKKLELLEINPLVLDSAGEWVCVDAKIVLDDNLCHKRGQESTGVFASFEESTHSLGVNGVELDGDIALITSGAGAGLATIDELASHGGTVRAFVDLGPLVYDGGKMMEVIELVYDLKPRVVLFNFYFQVARCDTLAEAIVNSLREIPVVVRARGRYEEEAREMLRQHGCYATREFNDAVLKTIETVSRETTAHGNLG
jgi:succinyl-CoA synthetase beta subunit